jgi:single-stranded DNA-binding protein
VPSAPEAGRQPTSVAVNAVVLTGYLAGDAELHTTGRGGRMVFLRLAFQRSPSRLDYVDVLVTDEQADRASCLRQGQRVLVMGRLQQHRWKAKAGAIRCKHAIVAASLEPLAAAADRPDPARPSPAS